MGLAMLGMLLTRGAVVGKQAVKLEGMRHAACCMQVLARAVSAASATACCKMSTWTFCASGWQVSALVHGQSIAAIHMARAVGHRPSRGGGGQGRCNARGSPPDICSDEDNVRGREARE